MCGTGRPFRAVGFAENFVWSAIELDIFVEADCDLRALSILVPSCELELSIT